MCHPNVYYDYGQNVNFCATSKYYLNDSIFRGVTSHEVCNRVNLAEPEILTFCILDQSTGYIIHHT